MPARLDATKAWREMKELRRDFDYLRKKFGGIPPKGLPFRNFAKQVIAMVDKRTRAAGFAPFPVVIDRKDKEPKLLDEIDEKGNVKKRNAKKTYDL